MNLWLVCKGMNHREARIQYILHQYDIIMSSLQYLSGDLFSYTNGAYEFCFEFCVVEVFMFWVKIRWTME